MLFEECYVYMDCNNIIFFFKKIIVCCDNEFMG